MKSKVLVLFNKNLVQIFFAYFREITGIGFKKLNVKDSLKL